MEQASEFVLLEKAVAKLTAIAQLSTAREPELKQNMDENDIMVLNWMQGAQVTTSTAEPRASVSRGPVMDVMGDMSLPRTELPAVVIEALDTEHFNPLDLSREVKMSLAVFMLNTTDGCSGWVRSNVREDWSRRVGSHRGCHLHATRGLGEGGVFHK